MPVQFEYGTAVSASVIYSLSTGGQYEPVYSLST